MPGGAETPPCSHSLGDHEATRLLQKRYPERSIWRRTQPQVSVFPHLAGVDTAPKAPRGPPSPAHPSAAFSHAGTTRGMSRRDHGKCSLLTLEPLLPKNHSSPGGGSKIIHAASSADHLGTSALPLPLCSCFSPEARCQIRPLAMIAL